MTFTLQPETSASIREDAGQTSSNTFAYITQSGKKYRVDCIVTSAGTATLYTGAGNTPPTAVADVKAPAYDGTQTTSFARIVEGATSIALSAASGTWTVQVTRLD